MKTIDKCNEYGTNQSTDFEKFVKSSDKPATLPLYFLANLSYPCMPLKFFNNQVKPGEIHAIFGLQQCRVFQLEYRP